MDRGSSRTAELIPEPVVISALCGLSTCANFTQFTYPHTCSHTHDYVIEDHARSILPVPCGSEGGLYMKQPWKRWITRKQILHLTMNGVKYTTDSC
jgi:hypothetical protein